MKLFKLILKLLFIMAIPISVQISLYPVIAFLGIGSGANASTVIWLLLITNVITIGLFLGYSKIMGRSISSDFRFVHINLKQIVLTLGIGICAMFVSLGISGFFKLQNLDPETVKSLETLVSAPYLFSLLSIGILAPIGEELVFRGAILRILRKDFPLPIAIFIQGVLFGLYHLNLVQAPPTAVLGIILGITVALTHSIWPAILIHVVNNTLALTISQLNPGGSASAEAIPEPGPLYFLIIGSVALVLVVMQLVKLKRASANDPLLLNDEAM